MSGASTLCPVGAVVSLCIAYLLLHEEEDAAAVRPERRIGWLFQGMIARAFLLLAAGCIVGMWLAK